MLILNTPLVGLGYTETEFNISLSMAVNVSNGKVDYVKCEINVGKPWECVPFLKNYANTFYKKCVGK